MKKQNTQRDVMWGVVRTLNNPNMSVEIGKKNAAKWKVQPGLYSARKAAEVVK